LKPLAKDLVKNYNIKQVLKIYEENESNPKMFTACHASLHYLGQEVYSKEKNISKVLAEGTPACFAGFYHGSLEGYLQEKSQSQPDNFSFLKKETPTICSEDLKNFSQKHFNECLHGLGHALMFATDLEVPKSLELCDGLKNTTDANWCYSGVFMENSTSSTNPDHKSNYIKKDDPLYPCNVLDRKYLNSCYTLQSFYFAQLVNYDWQKTADLCTRIPKDYIPNCFHAIGQSLVGGYQDFNRIKNICYEISSSQKDMCLSGVIGAMGEKYTDAVEKIIAFCEILDLPGKPSCYGQLGLAIKTQFPENQREIRCLKIKEAAYRQNCAKNI